MDHRNREPMRRTLTQLGQEMAKSFQRLNPVQQDQVRKAMYEAVTGKPYRGRSALMGVRCVGYKSGKYQIFDEDPGVRLDFLGPDARRFEQVNPPNSPRRTVKFVVTVKYLLARFPGFLPTVN
jgi:hypothetical protein